MRGRNRFKTASPRDIRAAQNSFSMKDKQKKSKKSSSKSPLSPDEALCRLRLRKIKRMAKKLREKCDLKIAKFYGKPLDVPIDRYLPDAVTIVEIYLRTKNWYVTRHSGLEGENPIIRLAMRPPAPVKTEEPGPAS